MRLIRRLQDGSFTLVSFRSEHLLPPYAILSHTWTDEEVTYNDVVVGAGKDKLGYAKLHFCSQQAAIDDLEYFWVDSCCIDKSSDDELSIAINSIYWWYQRAAKCYVHLSDVSVPENGHARVFRETWLEAFRRSRWFTRGWTLQELLAPVHVEFFSREGKRLGSRVSLEQEIHRVTKIPIDALRGRRLADFSLEERIGWAASRNTTLVEDSVYCLLGIFGVFLPPVYGEGKEHAMLRLREKIRQKEGKKKIIFSETWGRIEQKQTLDSYLAQVRPFCAVPFRRNPNFVNRKRLLDEIQEKCSTLASCVALVGLGGMGKSELAIEHCHITAEKSPETWVFWVNATNAVRLEEGFRDIADCVKIEGRQNSQANIFQLVHNWLRDSKDPWLLVLDDLDDATFLNALIRNQPPSAGDPGSGFRPTWKCPPYYKHGSIIITTRNRKAAFEIVEQRDIIAVAQLSEEEALALLRTRFMFGQSDCADASALVQALKYHPVAIIQAGMKIAMNPTIKPIASYLKLLREAEANSVHLVDKDLNAIQTDYDIQRDDDRLSIGSVESSTTLLSTFSDLTMVDRSATVELEKVFQEDVELIGLYRLALKDTSMEPEKLQRNVARLLQFFAKDLRHEAGGNLERVASRFVQSKAQYIAQCIVERFNDTPRGLQQQQETVNIESEEQGRAQLEGAGMQPHVDKDQTELEDEDEVAPIDEDYFEDLAILRTFLIRSSAFQIFRARLTKFVLPKSLRGADMDSIAQDLAVKTPLSTFRRFMISTSHAFEAVLIAAGCLEPPLQPGFIRLRWRCECGAPLFGDVQEYRIGGISRLIDRMERSINGKVTATSHNKDLSNQQYIPGPIIWVCETARNVVKAFSTDGNRSDTLPQHNGSSTTVTPASPDIESSPARDLLLLACVHESQGGQLLHQDNIGTMENDRQLFCFIRKQISRTPSRRWPARLLKTVTGIHFTQFHLRLNDDVEPRLHKLCCRQDACQCVPLTSNAEYDCQPAGPLDFGPPVLPSKMLHYFKHPNLISEQEMSILNQLPKRNCGRLQSTGQAPAEGWGLYYEESWDVGLFVAVIVVTTIVASLVFGIWWTLAKMDIQGAWGVSSYMLTACALVVGLVSIVGRANGE